MWKGNCGLDGKDPKEGRSWGDCITHHSNPERTPRAGPGGRAFGLVWEGSGQSYHLGELPVWRLIQLSYLQNPCFEIKIVEPRILTFKIFLPMELLWPKAPAVAFSYQSSVNSSSSTFSEQDRDPWP